MAGPRGVRRAIRIVGVLAWRASSRITCRQRGAAARRAHGVVPTAAGGMLPLDVFDAGLLLVVVLQFALRVRGAFAMPLAVFAP